MTDHESVMFTDCRPSERRLGDTGQVVSRKACGGRVMWAPGEPGWQKQIGFVGTCLHCGSSWFTSELLGHDSAALDATSPDGRRYNAFWRKAA